MVSSEAIFPDDIEALKALLLARETALREREDDLANLRDTVTTLRKTLSDRALEIEEHLKLWIAKLQRMQFGRKSEKIDRQIEQLELRLEDLQSDDGAANVDAPMRSRPEGRKSTGRKPLLDHLQRPSTLFTSVTGDLRRPVSVATALCRRRRLVGPSIEACRAPDYSHTSWLANSATTFLCIASQ